jgi:hypothetical protein
MAEKHFVYKREGEVCCLSSSGMGDRADRLIELRSEGKNHVFRHATDLGHLAQKLANIQNTARKIPLMYSFSGISRPESQFPHSCVCELHAPHGKENPIYVFHFWELRGVSLSFHVSVSDLYIPRINPHISL